MDHKLRASSPEERTGNKAPAPDVKQEPVKPEIPPDKVAPEKEGPTKAKVG